MPAMTSGISARRAASSRRVSRAPGRARGPRRARKAAQARRDASRARGLPARLGSGIAALAMYGRLAGRPLTVVSAILLAGAVGYGLLVGGHVGALAGDAAAGAKKYAASAGFRLDEVTVEGRNRTAAPEVLAALGAVQGRFIFDIDLEADRQRLEDLAWVERATVSRRLPGTIHVRLVEREPFAVWQRGGRLSLVDASGTIITDEGLADYAHLPLVVGHGAPESAAALMKQLMARPALAARVRASVRVAERRWNLKLRSGIEVRLPASELPQALGELERLDAETGILSRAILAVDMRIPGRIGILIDSESASQRRTGFRTVSGEGGRDA